MLNNTILNNFYTAIQNKDVDAAVNLFTEDAHFQNMSEPAVIGHENIRTTLIEFFNFIESISWEVISITTAENRIVLERINKIKANGRSVNLPTTTVLELDTNNHISALRDYFDKQTLTIAIFGA